MRFYRAWSLAVNSVALCLTLLASPAGATPVDPEDAQGRARRDEEVLARINGLVASGQFDLATEELDSAGAVADRDPRWLNLRGLTLAGQGRHPDAVSAYESGLRRDPGLAALHRNLAISLVELSARGRALSEFRQAVELDPSDAEGWLGLVSLQTALGRVEDARISLERLSLLQPEAERTWRARATLAARIGDPALALQSWTWLEAHHPRAETARRLGDLLQVDEPARALEHYVDCFARDPGAVDCREQASLLAIEAGQPGRAVEFSASALDSLSEAGFLNLLLAAQALPDAERIEGWVRRRPPESPAGWGVVALARRDAGRAAAALEAVRTGLDLAETADLYNLLGVLRAEAGQIELAREAWSRALEIDPGHVPARDNLAEHSRAP